MQINSRKDRFPVVIEADRLGDSPESLVVRIHANPEATGCDPSRTHVFAWSVGKNRALAERLKRALESGRVFDMDNWTLATDVNGKKYVSVTWHQILLGRRLSADLKRLGF